MTLKPPTGSNTPAWQRGGWENVAATHGAIPGSNCTTAFLSAKAALPSAGGVIFVPAAAGSKYILDPDAFSVDDTRSIRIVGEGGESGGSVPASTLHIGSNGTYGISAQSAFGFGMSDLSVTYDSSFTGSLFRFGQSAAALDPQLAAFERCQFGDGTQTSAARLFDLNKTVNATFDACNFTGGTRALRGRASSGASDYSNMVRFTGCRFGGFTSAPIHNPGEGWTFLGCTFQQLSSGAAGAISCDSSVQAKALTLLGCGFYDSTTTGKWIDLSAAQVTGFTFVGNRIGHADVGIDTQSSSRHLLIVGNDWEGTYTTRRVTYTTNNSNVVIAADTALDSINLDGTITFKGVSSNFISARAQNNVNNTMLAWSLGGANDTYRMFVNGTQEFGDGTAARDVSVGRTAADVWGSTLDTLVGKSLRTEHVGAATPTGGASGDIKVGTSKIWVNDAGTWKSVAIA